MSGLTSEIAVKEKVYDIIGNLDSLGYSPGYSIQTVKEYSDEVFKELVKVFDITFKTKVYN